MPTIDFDQRTERLISFLKPSQIRSYKPPEGSMLVGESHIVKGAMFVIGGAPGVGKSRASVALAQAGATGKPWFGLDTHRQFKTMILQNENGENRLKNEISDIPHSMEDMLGSPHLRNMDFSLRTRNSASNSENR